MKIDTLTVGKIVKMYEMSESTFYRKIRKLRLYTEHAYEDYLPTGTLTE